MASFTARVSRASYGIQLLLAAKASRTRIPITLEIAMSRVREVAAAAIASGDYLSIARTYCITCPTVETYVNRLQRDKPTSLASPGRAGQSARRKAIDMALAGASTDAICATLGLKRTTARVYRWEARQIAKRELKVDPLLL